jgi:hypothetical protein
LRKKQVYRYERDFEFAEYMQEAWPEHARRIQEARRAAPFVKLYYPLVGFLFSLVLAGGLSLLVTVLARQDGLWAPAEGGADSRLASVQSVMSQAVPVMWSLTVIVVLIVLMACISAGIARARELIFNAEKLEMGARMEYMLGGARRRVSNLDEELPSVGSNDDVAPAFAGGSVNANRAAEKKGQEMDIPPLSEY